MNDNSYKSKNKTIKIPNDVGTIELSLSPSRLISVRGVNGKGGQVERHLKITDRGKLLLV